MKQVYEPTTIVNSLLDTDLYKFTMMQCVFHHFRQSNAAYQFYCRKPVDLSGLAHKIKEQIDHLCNLTLTESELVYLSQFPFFQPDFIDFLSTFKLNPEQVKISANHNLSLKIKGPWLETILFEVPLLAIISESYYQSHYPNYPLTQAYEKLSQKVNQVKALNNPKFKFSDFGTRRRFSHAWQEQLIFNLANRLPHNFSGTSNVYFAKKFNLIPIGTMAHEYLQAAQVLAPNLKNHQNFALETWLTEYPNHLGIALTDSLGLDQFLKSFPKELAEKFQGVRHDSGDPYHWADKMLQHYQSLNIDPKNKLFVFSDGLTLPKAIAIFNHLEQKCTPTFGIGTDLTNDVGLEPLDIVIKMHETNSIAVIKYPDSKGKTICTDPARLSKLKQELNLRETS